MIVLRAIWSVIDIVKSDGWMPVSHELANMLHYWSRFGDIKVEQYYFYESELVD